MHLCPAWKNLLQLAIMQKLTGLVVCGGLSSRMGLDKSMVEWHSVAQRYFLYQMLEPLCDSVFISCNATQASDIEPPYNYIIDDEKYRNIGPMAALLTACNKFPNNSFLVIGCDYPFVKNEDILQLINSRNEKDAAVSFFNGSTGFYEPMIAIYENKFKGLLFENFRQRQYSLQSILKGSSVCKVNPTAMKVIEGINTPEAYWIAMEEIKKMN